MSLLLTTFIGSIFQFTLYNKVWRHGNYLVVSNMKLFRLASFCVLLLLSDRSEAAIRIQSGAIKAVAFDGTGKTIALPFFGTSIPTQTTLNRAEDANYSNNVIDWNFVNGQTILSLAMEHRRTGALHSSGTTVTEKLLFTANSNEPYRLTGYYNASNVGIGEAGDVWLYAELYDATDNVLLFSNYQYSEFTTNQHFVLGDLAGDYDNFLNGNLSGNLIVGHSYSLNTENGISTYPEADSGATAVGNVALSIGVAAVPESTAFIIWAVLILIVVPSTLRLKQTSD